ncbi:MAG: DUF192 domain-containing protein [Tepidisphaeraceae bacterium]
MEMKHPDQQRNRRMTGDQRRSIITTTFALLALAATAVCGSGCEDSRAAGALRTVPVAIGSKTFTLEIADTERSRTKGLMHRKSLSADHGMIFVFAREQSLAFWMKDTLIPLDILYLDASGKVVSIHQMKPLDRGTTRSAAPAKYAVELNEGAARSAGVKSGDTITLPVEVTGKK